MQSEKNKSIFWPLGLLVIACLYLFARLWRLTDSCLTFDEIFSVHAAEHSWREMFTFVAQDLIHPPLFYALLKIWVLTGGESILWLRLFPVVFSVLAVAAFLLLCREITLNKTETLTAFAFLAKNGALIRYSQEVRMYTVLFCLSIFSLWLFARFLNKKLSANLSLALFIANFLLIYTHYFGWFVIVAETLAVIVLRRNKSRQFLISVGILGASFLPWAWTIRQTAPTSGLLAQNIGWQSKPGLVKLAQFLLTLNEPFYYQQSSVDAANILLIALPMTLTSLAVIVWYCFRAGKDDQEIFKPGAITQTNSAFLLLILVLTPLLSALAASWLLPYSIWGVRHLIIIFPAFAILTAVAINRLPLRELRIAVYCLLGTLILTAAIINFTAPLPTFIWCGWSELAAEADAQTNQPTTVYVFEDDGAYQLWYALKNNPHFKIVSVKGYGDMPEDKAFFLPRGFGEVQTTDKEAMTGERFYLAFRETSWKPDKQVLLDLTARGYQISQPLQFTAQGVTAFLVPVEKTNQLSQ